MVKRLVLASNPRITNARTQEYREEALSRSCFFSRMLVGISEAIRSLPLSSFQVKATLHSLASTTGLLSITKRPACSLARQHAPRRGGALQGAIAEKVCREYTAPVDQKECKETPFNQWLAGLIDGDGSFLLSKKGYASLEIVMEVRDKHALYQIKERFGGS
jgi:hypothetical protein